MGELTELKISDAKKKVVFSATLPREWIVERLPAVTEEGIEEGLASATEGIEQMAAHLGSLAAEIRMQKARLECVESTLNVLKNLVSKESEKDSA